jgi:hypothetical protein
MRLSESEKETLVGPMVVGFPSGVLAALAVVGMDFDYGAHLYVTSPYSLTTIMVTHGILTFVAVAGGIVFLFGVLPIILPRILSHFSRSKDNPD